MCNVHYNSEYFPDVTQVRVLIEDEWDLFHMGPPKWLGFFNGNKSYKLIKMPKGTYPSKFSKKEKVIAPYLERIFTLKQCRWNLPTLNVYHATAAKNIHSILENNFNWRLAGKSRGVKYGKGVCFSKNMFFCSQFAPYSSMRIIETKILYHNASLGSKGDPLPKDEIYDSTKSPDRKVIVKFEDSDFLPLYIYQYK